MNAPRSGLPSCRNGAVDWRPGRLSNLWDMAMQRFGVSGIIAVVSVMAAWSEKSQEPSRPVDEEFKRLQLPELEIYRKVLVNLDLASSLATLDRMCAEFRKEECYWNKIGQLADEFVGRIKDETRARQFFTFSLREAHFAANPRSGWTQIIDRFPEIVDDVEEASRCHALSRHAATVFHSVQIIEFGLIELGKFLKVNDPKSGWTAVSNALKKVIDKKHAERTRFEKRNFAFLEQVQGTVEGLKTAWRNKISHAHGRLVVMTANFSPEVAEEIIFATRSFMRRLADGLPALKKPDVS